MGSGQLRQTALHRWTSCPWWIRRALRESIATSRPRSGGGVVRGDWASLRKQGLRKTCAFSSVDRDLGEGWADDIQVVPDS